MVAQVLGNGGAGMRRSLAAATALAVLGFAAPAIAAWTSSGSGSGTATAGTITASGVPSVTADGSDFDLAWSPGSVSGGGVVGYEAQRSSDNGSTWSDVGNNCGSAASPITATSCTDKNVPAGTYQYRVISRFQDWEAATSGASASVTPAVTIVSAVPNPVGTSDTSTALTWKANHNGAYSVRVGGSDCSTGNVVSTAGSGTYSTQPATVTTTILRSELVDGANTVRVCVGTDSATTSVTRTPASATHAFTVSPSTTTPTAGTSFNVTITAQTNGSTDSTYTGNKTLDWSGGLTIGSFAPVYPANPVSFTAGAATVSVTLFKAGAQTLTVTDHDSTTYTGSSTSVTVSAATPVLSFSACTNGATSRVKNTNFSTTVTRTGTDTYGNSTGTAAATVTLSPFAAAPSSNNNFTTQTVSFTAGSLVTSSANYETANGVATSTITGSATGYTAASCVVTTS